MTGFVYEEVMVEEYQSQEGVLGRKITELGLRIVETAEAIAESTLNHTDDDPRINIHYHGGFRANVEPGSGAGGEGPRVAVWNDASRGDFLYGNVMESGSGAHPIDAHDADNPLVFWWEKENTLFVGPHVNHPGTKAYHILIDALEAAIAEHG